MAKSTSKDTQALFHSLRSAYAATPTNLKVSLSSNFSFSLSIIEDLNTNRFFFCADHRSLCGFLCLHCFDPGILRFHYIIYSLQNV